MDTDDEFRRRAQEARQRALHACTEDERVNWLRLAEGWLGLIKTAQNDGQEDPSIH
jgi:hypothetical protein